MRASAAVGTSLLGIMLITNKLENSPSGGRELLCKLNYDVLKDIHGERLIVLELTKSSVHGLKPVLDAFGGYIDGVNSETISLVCHNIQLKNIRKLFVDGSNFGGIVKIVKARFPHVEILTFFHNVEVRFFLGSLRQNKTVRALAVAVANYLAEKKSVNYSDKIVCLSERDSRLLHKIYGRAATHVSPMALQEKLPLDAAYTVGQPVNQQPRKFALFVGGTFYANRAGIAWFVEHVVPHIHIKICIVGRGFEDLRQDLERDGKVEVVGAVDHLADWYRDAHFVIAPIFDGSGMKTKVAEALMYGKKIIGTPEAFSGYEGVSDQAGWVCATATEFVTAIADAEKEVTQSLYPALRMLYEEKYSFAAAVARLAVILADDCVVPVCHDAVLNEK